MHSGEIPALGPKARHITAQAAGLGTDPQKKNRGLQARHIGLRGSHCLEGPSLNHQSGSEFRQWFALLHKAKEEDNSAMEKLLIVVMSMLVLPVVINKTTENHLDWLKPNLRAAWLLIFGFLTLSFIWHEDTVIEHLAMLLSRFPGLTGYLLLLCLCNALVLAYWWFICKVIPATDGESGVKQKIEVLSLVRSALIVGQPLAAKYEIRNVSGKVINIRNIGFAQTWPIPRNLTEEKANEEAIWNGVSRSLIDSGRDAEIPTFGTGIYSQIIESNPLLGEEYAAILAGTHTVYFAAIVQDRDTKKNLIELCFCTGRDNVIHLCSQHNKP